jgi:hypothetical protein
MAQWWVASCLLPHIFLGFPHLPLGHWPDFLIQPCPAPGSTLGNLQGEEASSSAHPQAQGPCSVPGFLNNPDPAVKDTSRTGREDNSPGRRRLADITPVQITDWNDLSASLVKDSPLSQLSCHHPLPIHSLPQVAPWAPWCAEAGEGSTCQSPGPALKERGGGETIFYKLLKFFLTNRFYF